jgi:hypothetical protein
LNGKSRTLDEHKKHANEAGENLEMAKKAHEILKTTIKPQDEEKAKMHNEAIEKNHAEAKKHITNLKEELNKANPEINKAKSHAKTI